MTRLAAILATLLLVAAPAAATDGLPEWLTVRQLVPATLEPPAAPSTLAQEHGYAERLWRTALHLGADGTLREHVWLNRTFATSDAADAAGNVVITARTELESLELLAAYTILPDGRTVPVDPATLQLVSSSDTVFSDRVSVVIPLPALQPGAESRVEFVRTHQTNDWPLPWSWRRVPIQGHPIEWFEATISWDPDVPTPVWKARSEHVECQEEPTRIHCMGGSIPAFVIDAEVDAVLDVVPQVNFGPRTTWNDVVSGYDAVLVDTLRPSEAVRTKVAELGVDPAQPQLALSQIHRFVADEIRYVAMAHGERAVVPIAPAQTLARRYGDCKDKTALFVAMARAVGIEAWPVLVGTDLSDLDALLLPSWSYFDHMIACAKAGGFTSCFDLTAPRLAFGTLPAENLGRVALPIRRTVTAPGIVPRPDYGWRVELDARNELHCEGGLSEHMSRRYPGVWGGLLRNQLLERSSSAREEFLEEDYQSMMGDQTEPSIDVSDLRDPAVPLIIHSSTRYEGGELQEGMYREPDPWLRSYAASMTPASQLYRDLSDGLEYTATHRFEVCSEVEIPYVGPDLALESRFGSLHRGYEIHGRTVSVDTRFRVEPGVIDQEDLADYRRFLGEVAAHSRIWFMLAKP